MIIVKKVHLGIKVNQFLTYSSLEIDFMIIMGHGKS